MAVLRFCTPFLFLALVPLGAKLGGGWTLIAALATPVCLTGLDWVFGEGQAQLGPAALRGALWLPRLYVAAQLAVIVGAMVWAAQPGRGVWEAAGLALSVGVTTGVFGFVAAHELIHSRAGADRALGLMLLGAVFYMHFSIAHVHGHHRRAATREDPASARLGEALYPFLLRSAGGQFAEAWAFEAQRRRRAGRRAFGLGNRVVAYVAIEAALALAIGLTSLRELAFQAAVAVVAVALLESFNYVAHYGLTRRVGPDGRRERLGPQHAWNSGRRMNNWALFNMGRHSDHHRIATQAYARLEPLSGAPELPSGYAGALLMALAPPLWRRVMDPRARAAMAEPEAQREVPA